MKQGHSFLILLFAVATGCAAAESRELVKPGPSLPYRYVVAPPKIGFDPKTWNDDPSLRYAVLADPSTLQEALHEGIRRESIFREGSLLPDDVGDKALMKWAAKDGADLILESRVLKRLASYEGRNGLFLPNLVVWCIAWPPSWFLNDETYALELEVEVDLKSLHSGKSIYSGVHRVTVKEDLNDFERGWQLLGIFRVPGSLGAGNWKCVDDSLGPEAEKMLGQRVGSEMREEVVRSVGTPRFREALARRYALVIGISKFQDHGIQNLGFADADARAFHAYLTDQAGIPAHNTRLLLNGQATAERIRSALAEFSSSGLAEDDEILIYFAGYGAWQERRAYLLPFDADSERLKETALPLADLSSLSIQDGGPRFTLVLDAPFPSRFQGRSTGDETTESLDGALEEILALPNAQVLSASRIGEGCLEIEDFGQGVFTHYLIDALEGQGDGDGDGEVTWEEACRYAAEMAEGHALLEGVVQHPGFYRSPGSREVAEEEVQHP